MIKMENDVLSVEIAEHGAELTKLYNKKTGTDLLWDAEPKFWKRHSPVLFPNVGKTYKNTVKINGTQYPTSQHGFARDSEFKCIHAGKETSTFLLTSTDEMKEVYPFDFELFITYTLEKNVLHVKWEVKNPSDETIYFTIGAHPAFRFAKNEEGKTGTISQKIAMVIQDGDYMTAGVWVAIVMVIAFLVIFLMNLISGKKMKNVKRW